MRPSFTPLLLAASIVTALLTGGCAAEEPPSACTGDKCDALEPDDACASESRDRDGVCDATCAEPDLDCFLVFEDQPAASAWFAGVEAVMAAQQSRPPRTLLGEDDPRYAPMRRLLDEGWEAYRGVFAVGGLATSPELVLVDDPFINAFVSADTASGRSAWAVMVNTGLLDAGAPDDEVLGVVMHELTHAVKLHGLPGVLESVRIHYLAAPGAAEPLGFAQVDDPLAREAISAWLALGREAGGLPDEALNGIPTGAGVLALIFTAAKQRFDLEGAACAPARELEAEMNAAFVAHLDPLDSSLALDAAAEAELGALTAAFLAELRDGCMAGSDLDLIELAAAVFGAPEEAIASQFSPQDLALIEGEHIVDQITRLGADRHRRMREIDAMLLADTGAGAESLRYFSGEEQADDATVPVLAAMGLRPAGVGEFMVNHFMPESARPACDAVLAAGEVPPYGDLTDEHHASCWRKYHAGALADHLARPAARTVAPRSSRAPGAYLRVAGDRLPTGRPASVWTSEALHR